MPNVDSLQTAAILCLAFSNLCWWVVFTLESKARKLRERR